MAERLPAVKTPTPVADLIQALWAAWIKFFGVPPANRESIWILTAQTGLETGWMSQCYGWNLGNVKSREGDGYDYQFYACNEILSLAQAQKYVAKDPTTAKVTTVRSDGKAIIWFYPDNPGCRFRAHQSLHEGALDHLRLLVRRFEKAWPEVIEGDVRGYSHALRLQKYYTADEASYTKTLEGCFKIAAKAVVDYDSLPFLGEDEKDRLKGIIAHTADSIVRGEFPEVRQLPDEDDDDLPSV